MSSALSCASLVSVPAPGGSVSCGAGITGAAAGAAACAGGGTLGAGPAVAAGEAPGASGGVAIAAVVGAAERDRLCRRAMMARAGATRRPLITCSRMRASSSRLAWITSNTASSAVTVPLSIDMTSVSSSWLRSPMGVMPAMRAPPLRVCSGRLKLKRKSALLGCERQSVSARSEASMSSVASSVKMAATSGSKSTASSPGCVSGPGASAAPIAGCIPVCAVAAAMR